MFVHPEVDFKKSKTQIILKRKKKLWLLNPIAKYRGNFPKPSRENPETSLRFPRQRPSHGLFRKHPSVVGTGAIHKNQGWAGITGHLNCCANGDGRAQHCVLQCASARVTAMRSSRSQTLHTYSTKWTHTPVHGIQVQLSCTCHWELSKSKDLKRS